MRQAIILLRLLSMILVAAGTARGQGSFTVNGKEIDIDRFNREVPDLLKGAEVPGLSLAVIDHGQVVFYNTYGYKKMSTREPVDTGTIFEACSLSKNFLTFAAYQLIDEGKLDLDKPMYTYLPYPPLEHDPRYKLITPRMVLSHSSGLENWKRYGNPDTLDMIADPGTRYIYSGEGYEYLAKVMETILHKPYKEFISEMVFEPLNLRHTYSSYSADGKFPDNYATGHDALGTELPKWKNTYTLPAAGVHVTAADYAQLIAAFFDGKHLSAAPVRQLLTPVIQLDNTVPNAYYGPGFELLLEGDDTIVSHGGDNQGFKNIMYYSTKHQCGLVFFTNGDLGKSMAARLCQMTVGLNIAPYLAMEDVEQYPCDAARLLKIYKAEGEKAMLSKIGELTDRKEGRISEREMNEMAFIFWEKDKRISKKLLEMTLRLYPASAEALFVLGELEMQQGEYQSADIHLRKAREFHVKEEEVDFEIAKCSKALKSGQR